MPKSNAIQIIIPSPCTQNWEEMTPDARGRHCTHCNKSVIDFTTWTDVALYNFFSKNKDHVCGRFFNTQLDHPISIPPQPHSRLYRMTVALGLTLLFTQAPGLHAQTRPPQAQQYAAPKPQETIPHPYGAISGKIVDERREPAINAFVNVFQGGILKGSAVTDYDGNYSVKPLDTGSYNLVITYQGGYDTLRISGVGVTQDTAAIVNGTLKRQIEIIERQYVRLGGPMGKLVQPTITVDEIRANPTQSSKKHKARKHSKK